MVQDQDLKSLDYYKVIANTSKFNDAFEKALNLYNGFIREENNKFKVVELSDYCEFLDLELHLNIITISQRQVLSNDDTKKRFKIVLIYHINQVLKDINEFTKMNFELFEYNNYKYIATKNNQSNGRFHNKNMFELYETLCQLNGLFNEMKYNKKLNGE